MYNKFFGLRENPFNVNVDPRFFFPTQQTEEALRRLAYGIQNRKGLILLTGEVGTGKTMMINQLLDWLRQLRTPTAFVFNSNLGNGDLFYLMACDFGIATEPNDRMNLQIRLNRWLLECYRAGVSPVLIVDEAQGLSFERMEEIRLLLNIETSCEKMVQIVLAGQPELEDKLNQPEGRQLRQRIPIRCKIDPLSREQTHGYIEQRLRIAGAHGEPIFVRQAMDAVYFYARGIPRVINLICEHSLINAYVDELRSVPAHIVDEVAREFQLDEVRPFHPTLTSYPVTANDASVAAQESVETQRAQAAVASVSSRSRETRLNDQPAPALPNPQALSAAPGSAEASALMNIPVRLTAVSAIKERRRQWPLILPASTRTAPHAVVMTPAPSRFFAAVPPPEANGIEKATRQRRWMPIPRRRQTLRRWWIVCRDKCLSTIDFLARRRTTSSLLRWLRSSTPRANPRRLQNVHHGRDWVLTLLYRCRPGWLDRCIANIVQTTRQQRTAIFRWLQQPLSSAHRQRRI